MSLELEDLKRPDYLPSAAASLMSEQWDTYMGHLGLQLDDVKEIYWNLLGIAQEQHEDAGGGSSRLGQHMVRACCMHLGFNMACMGHETLPICMWRCICASRSKVAVCGIDWEANPLDTSGPKRPHG